MGWIDVAWVKELESLVVAYPLDPEDVKRPSWWRESLNHKIGWNEKKRMVEAGAQTAYYGPPIETPCSTDGLQRDHQVPWENALRSGLVCSPAARREDFYNFADNVFILDAHVNDVKSDHTPDVWRPANRGVWQKYARDWIDTKSTWGLSISEAEKDALAEMLHTYQPGG